MKADNTRNKSTRTKTNSNSSNKLNKISFHAMPSNKYLIKTIEMKRTDRINVIYTVANAYDANIFSAYTHFVQIA